VPAAVPTPPTSVGYWPNGQSCWHAYIKYIVHATPREVQT
jgi:hypothetical protein